MSGALRIAALISALLVSQPATLWAKGPPPGKPVGGLQAELTLSESQQQPFRINDKVVVEIALRNVGTEPVTLYQGYWTNVKDQEPGKGWMVSAYTVDKAASEQVARFTCGVPAFDRSVSHGQGGEGFVQLAPGESLKKHVELRITPILVDHPECRDVVVMVSLRDHVYKEFNRSDIPKPWTGIVTSNVVPIEVVRESKDTP